MCTHCASTCSPHARSRSPVFSRASGPVAETGPRPAQARGAPTSQATTWAWAGHSASAQSHLGPKAAREALGRRWPSDRIRRPSAVLARSKPPAERFLSKTLGSFDLPPPESEPGAAAAGSSRRPMAGSGLRPTAGSPSPSILPCLAAQTDTVAAGWPGPSRRLRRLAGDGEEQRRRCMAAVPCPLCFLGLPFFLLLSHRTEASMERLPPMAAGGKWWRRRRSPRRGACSPLAEHAAVERTGRRCPEDRVPGRGTRGGVMFTAGGSSFLCHTASSDAVGDGDSGEMSPR